MKRLLHPLPSDPPQPGQAPAAPQVLLLAAHGDDQARRLQATLAADARIGPVALWTPAAPAGTGPGEAPAVAWPSPLSPFSHVLLCHPAGPADSAAEIWALRQALHAAGRAYQVLHGPSATQRARALAALGLHEDDDAALQDRVQRLRPWACEKCSDPACEHQLFAALQATRDGRSG